MCIRDRDGVPAEVLACTQRFGGWPHVALVSVINGTAYYADGVLPALPPMQRAIGVMSGRIAPSDAGQTPVAASDQILAQRLAAQAFSSGDIGHYEALMALGTKANQEENFPAAVIAYRAALALQQKKIGLDNPGTIAPMLELALNLSDQAQYPQAASMFAAVAKLVPESSEMCIRDRDSITSGGASLSAPGGTVAIAPYTPGTAIDLGGTAAGLDLSGALLGAVSGSTARLDISTTGSIAADGAVSVAAGALRLNGNGVTFNGTLDVPGALELASTNGVTTSSGETLTAGTLLAGGGISGPVNMALGSNFIGTLGALSLSGGGNDLALNDQGALDVICLLYTSRCV